MKKILLLTLAMLFLTAVSAVSGPSAGTVHGPSLYKEHAGGCHQSVLKFKLARDYVDIIRNPPGSMPAFSRDRVSDTEARAMSATTSGSG